MNGNSENPKGEAAPTGSPVVDPPSCRKKKSEVNEGFVKDMISHMDEFVHASYDEHKSCLHKTLQKMFGGTKAVGNSPSAPAPPPTVSVLPLRADTSTD